jgi:hypothetical protein
MSDKFVLFLSGLESEEGIRTQGRAACRDGVKRDGIPGKQRVVYVVLPSSAEPKKSKAPRSDMEFAARGGRSGNSHSAGQNRFWRPDLPSEGNDLLANDRHSRSLRERIALRSASNDDLTFILFPHFQPNPTLPAAVKSAPARIHPRLGGEHKNSKPSNLWREEHTFDSYEDC